VLVKGKWNEDFLRQARAFPRGKHDDKIDAVAGDIHTTRPDTKNAQYLAALKAGGGRV
jgi:phage terminase large subunit-like protein